MQLLSLFLRYLTKKVAKKYIVYMKNKYIDTYKTIYSVDIVVANKHTTIEDLRENYTYFDGAEIDNSIEDGIATTARCKNKNNNRYTVLIKYNHDNIISDVDLRLDFINTVSHEAVHVALDIMSFIGQDLDKDGSNEYFTYLVGYAAECIYNTWTKK